MVVIPGRNRGEAVIMADHYDTAYMEDVYETARGGDRAARLAAAGADDNHSATAALAGAADVLLDARAARASSSATSGCVHLTGEEFPSDCLGARAFCRALVERRLVLHSGDAQTDLSRDPGAGLRART